MGGEPQHSARRFQGGGCLLLSHCYCLVDCSVTTLGAGCVGSVHVCVCVCMLGDGDGVIFFPSGS